MRTCCMLVAAGVIALANSPVSAEPPTAQELLRNVAQNLEQIRALETDMEGSRTSGTVAEKFAGHAAMQTTEVGGQTTTMDFIESKWTTIGEDGKEVTHVVKRVNDGMFVWWERHLAGEGPIEVRKLKVTAKERGMEYLLIMRALIASRGELAYGMAGEETIRGRRMYVLKRHYVMERQMEPGTPPLTATVTEKSWIGQDDLLVHCMLSVVCVTGEETPRTLTMEFTNTKTNEQVNRDLFRYVPPEGIEVTEDEEP